jgi:hypothetical protein
MAGITNAQIAGSSKNFIEANTDASGVVNVGAVIAELDSLGGTGLQMFESEAAKAWTGLSEDQRKILESDFKAETALNIGEQKNNMQASNLEVYAERDARNEALRSLGGRENADRAAADDRIQRENVQKDVENGNLSGPGGQRAVPWFAAAVEDPSSGRISSRFIEERARDLVMSWQRAADTKDFTVNMAVDVEALETEVKEMGLTKYVVEETEDGPVYAEVPLTDDDISWTVFNAVGNQLMNYKGIGSEGFLFDRARELDARVKDFVGGDTQDPEVRRQAAELGGAARENYLRAILSAGNAAELEEQMRTVSADFLVKAEPLRNTPKTHKRITDARSGVTGQMPGGDYKTAFKKILDLGTVPGQDFNTIQYSPAYADTMTAVKADTASRLASAYGGDGGDFYPHFITPDKNSGGSPFWRFIRPDGNGGFEIYDVKMSNKDINAYPMKFTADGFDVENDMNKDAIDLTTGKSIKKR